MNNFDDWRSIRLRFEQVAARRRREEDEATALLVSMAFAGGPIRRLRFGIWKSGPPGAHRKIWENSPQIWIWEGLPDRREVFHCFVSLAIFRSLTADNVHDDQLEKILWIFANAGSKRDPRVLPDWVQADPTATLFVNLLLHNNDHLLGAGLEKAASDVPEIKHSSPVSTSISP
ncbi:hypothetical protein PGTUg99_033915 [Puccinia graminis f. sp. tritici]|uniref:Uncharacterized protein n=1 Tax=Puccinia graminis f. sp. tritici TaxID=56615 RepID=A0A5B0R846_PUCGR|nr:hypothetical protein PGTUg99_033915 [Puccinia graminis f. sp. tritici]